jgi:hypothetical protein
VANISVIAPEAFEGMPAGGLHLIVVNSVVQYLSLADVQSLLATAREKLALDGRIVLADIVPRGVGPIGDALQLLKFGAANGFLAAAFAGLVRSYFSNYRKVREGLGFLQLDEKEMFDLLAKAGFSARRHYPNMGHNARRMTFVATRA